MALPQEVDAEKVRVVKEAIAKMSSQEIVGLPSIDKDDFRLFGAITQLYCFLDLNLRAALEVMHRANRLPPESVSKYPDYRDAALSAILKGSAVRMDPKVEKLEETLFRLDEIGRCRTYRNLIAHFAGQRYPNADVYVFTSRSDRDARQALGESLPVNGVHISIAGRSELFELEGLLNGHSGWLSAKVVEWNKRYSTAAAALRAVSSPLSSAPLCWWGDSSIPGTPISPEAYEEQERGGQAERPVPLGGVA